MVRIAYFFRRKYRKLSLTSLASFLNAAKYFPFGSLDIFPLATTSFIAKVTEELSLL